LNAQKDRINELGSVRFAAETGQSLTHFYSINRFGSPPDVADNRPKRKKLKVSGKHVSDEISHALQKIIWDLPPSATNHFPGKLSLCIGMPVIIIDKKKKGAEIEAATEVETLNIQSGFVTAKGSVPVNSGKKQKHEEAEISIEITKIKKAVQIAVYSDDHYSPSGLVWDGDNYSCAYDGLFIMLFEIWSTDVKVWTRRFKAINQHHLKSLTVCFKYMDGQTSFETARDAIRREIHAQNPAEFTYGTGGTSVTALTAAILAPHDIVAVLKPECIECDYSGPIMDDGLQFLLYEKADTPKSTSQWLGSLKHHTHERCPNCSSALTQPISFVSALNVLAFDINSRNIKISKTLKFLQDGESIVLKVRGLIYHGNFHFTSRIIGTDGIVWYHDGITTGSTCENEGDFDKFSNQKIMTSKGKSLTMVVYARV